MCKRGVIFSREHVNLSIFGVELPWQRIVMLEGIVNILNIGAILSWKYFNMTTYNLIMFKEGPVLSERCADLSIQHIILYNSYSVNNYGILFTYRVMLS